MEHLQQAARELCAGEVVRLCVQTPWDKAANVATEVVDPLTEGVPECDIRILPQRVACCPDFRSALYDPPSRLILLDPICPHAKLYGHPLPTKIIYSPPGESEIAKRNKIEDIIEEVEKLKLDLTKKCFVII